MQQDRCYWRHRTEGSLLAKLKKRGRCLAREQGLAYEELLLFDVLQACGGYLENVLPDAPAKQSPPLPFSTGSEELELVRLAVPVVEDWFEGADVVLLQAEHLLLVGVLLEVNECCVGAFVPVLDDAPEDVAGLAHVDAGAGLEDEVEEVGIVVSDIP